jgi:hypothetical protein
MSPGIPRPRGSCSRPAAPAGCEGYDGESIRCVRRVLRSFTDDEIYQHARRDKASPPPATERLATLVGSCHG